MAQPKPKQRYLPLRDVVLTSRPLVKRALAFSCDGELAVTADDSVHVFIPEYPDLPTRLLAGTIAPKPTSEPSRHQQEQQQSAYPDPTVLGNSNAHGGATANGNGHLDGESGTQIGDDENGDVRDGNEGESSGEEWVDSFENSRINTRAQFSEGSKHMPVSYPPLDPRINRELFTSLGLPFPYDGDTETKDSEAEDSGTDGAYGGDEEEENGGPGYDAPDSDIEASDEEEESEDSDEDDDEFGGPRIDGTRPFGAGTGPITGAGSTMNHVVCISWSPSGLGINLRPILAILTSSGTLAMYGDGGRLDNVLPRANKGMLQRRELSSWIVLWGVGERLMVPGQQADVTENIQGFAWAKEVGPGQALLATINDAKEVAIISVQTVILTDRKQTNPSEGREIVEWRVQELVRFKAVGPHPKLDVMDPDYTPCGTSFGLRFTPWLLNDASRSCLISYIDRNYIGFRRITIDGPWVRGEVPNLVIGEKDLFGKCINVSTDAFVEFEDVILSDSNGNPMCRGILATPLHLIPLEVPMNHDTILDSSHPTSKCDTTYTSEDLPWCDNPIVDMVIHPPDLNNPAPIPLYTIIRLSATVTTKGWHETNIPAPLDDTVTPAPLNDPVTPASPDGLVAPTPQWEWQWARTIQNQLEIAVPADMHRRRGYVPATMSEDEESDESDSDFEDDDDDDDGEDEVDSDYEEEFTLGPEIHLYRFRMHGLAVSPGGGATAVLTSVHNTQHPERGGWHTVRSTVHFGYRPRIRPKDFSRIPLPPYTDGPTTVEGRLFEYLYGGGPPVPGINISVDADNHLSHYRKREHRRLKELFKDAFEKQKCDVCQSSLGLVPGGTGHGHGKSACDKGHYFHTCATSGLAVQLPGITRSCGTCGLRSIRPIELVKMPGITEKLVKELNVCGWCGGKFLN